LEVDVCLQKRVKSIVLIYLYTKTFLVFRWKHQKLNSKLAPKIENDRFIQQSH
jgi:hypothetical protein